MTAAALRCLFVKETREQGWAIPVLFAVEYSVVMLAVGSDSGLTALSFALMGVVPLAAILLGINIGAGEASRGTLEFLQAQPISGAWVALAKLSVASASAVIAALLAVAASGVWTHADSQGAAALTVAVTLTSLSFVCWSAAASLHQKDEVRGSCAALATFAALWLAVAPWTAGASLSPLRAALPGFGFELLNAFQSPPARDASNLWLRVVLPALCGAAAPAAFFLRRYGRTLRSRSLATRTTVAQTPSPAQITQPHASMARALIWKQQRDFAPLAYAAVGGIVVVSALTHWESSTTHEYGYASAARAIGTVFAISVYLGILASLVAGVGLFVEDLRTAEHEFWRSRPIPVDQWFWTKYVTGWSVLVGAMAIPTLLTLVGVWLAWGAAAVPTDPHARNVATQAVAASLLAVSACYGTSAAVMTFVRRPVLAAALALAVFLSALGGVSELASRYGDNHRLIPYCWLAVGIAFSLATPLVAWRRIRALAA